MLCKLLCLAVHGLCLLCKEKKIIRMITEKRLSILHF